MAQTVYQITLSEFEKRLLINALMDFHNNLLSQNKTTEDVDTLIEKALYAPARKERRWGRNEAR